MKDFAPQLFSIEAEQQVLGACLIDNDRVAKVADILRPEHFFDPLHADMWRHILARVTKRHLASPITLKADFQNDTRMSDVGGVGYIARMAGAVVAGGAVRDIATEIIQWAAKRALNEALLIGTDELPNEELGNVVARLQIAIRALPEAEGEETSISLMTATTSAIRDANEMWSGERTLAKTGIPELDAILHGLGRGDLMLLGGATSMGKTATAVHIAKSYAMSGQPVVYWSLEMRHDQIANRIIASNAGLNYALMRDPTQLSEADFRKWVEKSRDVAQGAMQIIPTRIRDIGAGLSAIEYARDRLGGLSLVVVDYAQLVRGQGKSRFEQMSDVATSLKTLGGLLDVPVIALVQLDRKIGEREDTRPQLSDIKESGQFENDADQVVFCHREGYWLQRRGPAVNKAGVVTDEARADFEADMSRHKNRMELIVRKNRHGKLATATVGFHAPTNRIWSLQEEAGFDEQY